MNMSTKIRCWAILTSENSYLERVLKANQNKAHMIFFFFLAGGLTNKSGLAEQNCMYATPETLHVFKKAPTCLLRLYYIYPFRRKQP